MKYLGLVMAFCVLLVQAEEWLAIGSFRVHQQQIASKWCKSANLEKNCCAGKCWLTKILDNIHDNESPDAVAHQLEKSSQYEVPSPMRGFIKSIELSSSPPLAYRFDYVCTTIFKVFRPPS